MGCGLQVVNVSVATNTVVVTDAVGKPVPSQLTPVWQGAHSQRWTLFFAATVPPLGFATYFVTARPAASAAARGQSQTPVVPWEPIATPLDAAATFTLANEFTTATFENATGALVRLQRVSSVDVPVHQSIMQYINGTGGAVCCKGYCCTLAAPTLQAPELTLS